jgi:hypothetical protein
MNPDVDAGTEQIWPPGTIQVLPTSVAVASVVSDSTDDDGDPAGTGALTLTVFGLDTDYNEVEETVTLNGVGAVTTTQTFLRVHRAYVLTAGSAGTNVGNISISVGGNLQAYIEASEGQTHITQFTVPANHIAVVEYYAITTGRVGNFDIQAQLQIRKLGEAWRSVSDAFPYEGGFALERPLILLPAKTDVRGIVTTDGTNQNLSMEYSGYLIHEDQAFWNTHQGSPFGTD